MRARRRCERTSVQTSNANTHGDLLPLPPHEPLSLPCTGTTVTNKGGQTTVKSGGMMAGGGAGIMGSSSSYGHKGGSYSSGMVRLIAVVLCVCARVCKCVCVCVLCASRQKSYHCASRRVRLSLSICVGICLSVSDDTVAVLFNRDSICLCVCLSPLLCVRFQTVLLRVV